MEDELPYSRDSARNLNTAGESPEEMVLAFPTLQLADVYAVLACYLSHRSEVDAYIDENRRAAGEVRRAIEARSPQAGLREKLLIRRAALQQAP